MGNNLTQTVYDSIRRMMLSYESCRNRDCFYRYG